MPMDASRSSTSASSRARRLAASDLASSASVLNLSSSSRSARVSRLNTSSASSTFRASARRSRSFTRTSSAALPASSMASSSLRLSSAISFVESKSISSAVRSAPFLASACVSIRSMRDACDMTVCSSECFSAVSSSYVRVAASRSSRYCVADSSASMTRARSFATRILSAVASPSRAFADDFSASFIASIVRLSSDISSRSPGTIADSSSFSAAAARSVAMERLSAYRSRSLSASSRVRSCAFTADIARVRACCSDASLLPDASDAPAGLVAILLPSVDASGVLDSDPSASSDTLKRGALKKRSASVSAASFSWEADRTGAATCARTARSRGACRLNDMRHDPRGCSMASRARTAGPSQLVPPKRLIQADSRLIRG